MAPDLLVSVLASTATLDVARRVGEIVRDHLQKRGAKGVPQVVLTREDLQQAERALSAQGEQLPPDEASKLTRDALAAAHQTANGIRAERMRQARLTFNAALALAVLGVLIIFVGVGLLLFREAATAGALTAGIGAVTEVISTILFRFNNETNNRLDEIGKDLSSIEAAQIAVTLIEKIEDPAKRDDAIREVARELRAKTNK